MQLATLRNDYGDESLHYFHDRHFIAVEDAASVFGAFFSTDLRDLIESGDLPEMIAWWDREADERLPRMPEFSIHQEAATPVAPIGRSGRLWGIDTSASPAEPATFLRPDSALVGPGDELFLPGGADRTTGAAALGVVIGKECRDVPESDWLSVVAGFTSALEVTAEDRLRKNPRDLVLAKGFDRSLSLGPLFLSPDELPEQLGSLALQAWLNGELAAEGRLSESVVSPDQLVAEISRGLTLKPGDVIVLAPLPGIELAAGDTLECRIEGAPFLPLVNPVGDRSED